MPRHCDGEMTDRHVISVSSVSPAAPPHSFVDCARYPHDAGLVDRRKRVQGCTFHRSKLGHMLHAFGSEVGNQCAVGAAEHSLN